MVCDWERLAAVCETWCKSGQLLVWYMIRKDWLQCIRHSVKVDSYQCDMIRKDWLQYVRHSVKVDSYQCGVDQERLVYQTECESGQLSV